MTTLSQEQMLDVMAYADGELAGEEAARVSALLEESAEAKELFTSLQAIGDGVRSVMEEPADVDVADAVMRKLQPNDLDKARIRRTNRIRMGVVGASLVALAAAFAFYLRQAGDGSQARNPAPSLSGSDGNALASLHATGVEVDSVDTPSSVSVFYVPTDNPAEPKAGPSTLVVWVDDPEVAP